MTVDGHATADSTLVDSQITLINTAGVDGNSSSAPKTVDDVWREIVSGKRRKMKEEAPDELMTLEDFLAKAEASVEEDDRVKVEPAERISGGGFRFEPMPRSSSLPVVDTVEVMGGGGGGRRKRGRAVLEQLDKAAQQRQRGMIKNRESAARSRERKQAYQVELESLAVRLEEENEQLLKEKEERTKERFKQLMEKVIPVVEKRKPARVLQRVCSSEW